LYELEGCFLHDWLVRTASESPDAVAILEDGRKTSLGELLVLFASAGIGFIWGVTLVRT